MGVDRCRKERNHPVGEEDDTPGGSSLVGYVGSPRGLILCTVRPIEGKVAENLNMEPTCRVAWIKIS